MSSAFFVDCPSLVYSWPLVISLVGLSVISGGFPKRFLKCSFHFCSILSRLVAFNFGVNVFFLPLTSFFVCHGNRDCLLSTKFLILLIWPCMYSSWVFFVCFIYHLSFVKLLLTDSVLVSLINKGYFFLCYLIFTNWYWLTYNLALCLVGMQSTAVSVWALTKF